MKTPIAVAGAASALVLSLSLAPAEVSFAQGADEMEEVVVTAQKREESLQDTPISVAAFASEELEAIGAFEAGQVAEYTANLTIDRQPSSMDNYGYSIRGVGSGETSLLVENTVVLSSTRAWLPMQREQPGISMREPAASKVA